MRGGVRVSDDDAKICTQKIGRNPRFKVVSPARDILPVCGDCGFRGETILILSVTQHRTWCLGREDERLVAIRWAAADERYAIGIERSVVDNHCLGRGINNVTVTNLYIEKNSSAKGGDGKFYRPVRPAERS